MTQEVKPIPRGAQELRRLLREQGSVAKEEIRQWLAEQDPELTPGDINFVIGHGEAPNRLWWHEDAEGLLVSGPKPGSKPVIEDTPGQVSELSDEIKKPPLLDPSEMSEPRSQFYTIALNLGIAEKAARTTAFSCWGTTEMFDPAEAWQAILQSPELRPSQKKTLWRNWCSWAGIKIPEALADKVEQQYGVLSKTEKPTITGIAPGPRRRFIPVKGEVLMVEPDDPSGMSFSEALMTAQNYQKVQAESQQAPAAPAESPTVAAMVTVLGNLTTAALTPRTDPAAANSTLEIVKLMVEGARSESTNAVALIKQDLDHRLEIEARDRKAAEERSNAILLKLTDLIERQGQPRNPFDSLDAVLPGIGAKLLDMLVNPPHQEGIFKVTFGDQEGNMSLDQYERFSKVENQKEFTKMLRMQLPEFFAMGRDFAAAAKRAPQGDHEEPPASRQPDPGFNGYCVACIRMLRLPENVEQFTCPHCGALQNLAGEVLDAAPVEQEELRTEELPPGEESAADVFDTDALVLRPLDRDRESSPEPAREAASPHTSTEAVASA